MNSTNIFMSLPMLALVFLGYLIALVVYRLFFSPLSKLPGPKLAALSSWYEFYYDVLLQGSFTMKIQELHQQYGPIIRITPWELHIDDPEYYDTLYSAKSSRRNKPAYMSWQFGYSSDTFATTDHDLHRMRRKALAPFFTPAKVTDFQTVIRTKVDRLCTILQQDFANSPGNNVVAMDRAWVALTTDIITEYSFAKSYDHLENPRFHECLHEALMAIYTTAHLNKHFSFVPSLLDALPEWLVKLVNPDILPVVGFRNDLRRQIGDIRVDMKEDKAQKTTDHPTIFHELLLSPEIPPAEKTDARLGDEALLVVAAGLVTTSWSLALATFHLARNPKIVAALREELQSRGLTQPYDWNTLQRLPYLYGVVHEAIRLSHGTTNRHPRLAPETELVYGQWKIPRNTPVSMTTVDVTMNKRLFPEPEKFIPERWIKGGADLERYFVPFGKGSRQCLGLSLAQAELYIAIATVFTKFDFELYETDESDVDLKHAYLIPYPKWDTKGVRVTVSEAGPSSVK